MLPFQMQKDSDWKHLNIKKGKKNKRSKFFI